ncbi:YfiR family protein [Candidatus Albibeggiatoa sp. nov. BB20]|uniref:YfiR family protein n=1 Tax=Candidatus Albibeggiatoa sp. nov. BB20 TaxID=3162723 RepID=UPI00336550D1
MLKIIIKPIVIALMFFCIFHISPMAKAAGSKEKDVKAIFLFNFTQFITWPEHTFNSVNALFNICILGKNPFGGSLSQLLKNEMVNDHPMVLNEFDKIEQVEKCHILYVSSSRKRDLKDIFTFVQGKSILTVSDIKKFAQKGGMVGFFKQKRKIRFYIAPQSMRDVGLVPNSNLLRVAKIVER